MGERAIEKETAWLRRMVHIEDACGGMVACGPSDYNLYIDSLLTAKYERDHCVGALVMLTYPIAKTESTDFVGAGSRGVVISREYGRPRVAVGGQEILCLDSEIRRSPW